MGFLRAADFEITVTQYREAFGSFNDTSAIRVRTKFAFFTRSDTDDPEGFIVDVEIRHPQLSLSSNHTKTRQKVILLLRRAFEGVFLIEPFSWIILCFTGAQWDKGFSTLLTLFAGASIRWEFQTILKQTHNFDIFYTLQFQSVDDRVCEVSSGSKYTIYNDFLRQSILTRGGLVAVCARSIASKIQIEEDITRLPLPEELRQAISARWSPNKSNK